METWTKLFSSIVTSSVWQEPWHIKLVWITLLALKDRDGIIHGSIPGIGHLAGVTTEQADQAIQRLMQPDPYSRTKDNEGRRIAEIEGGWRVLNHELYRDSKADYRRAYNARKQREYRKRKANPFKRVGAPMTREERMEANQ